MTTAIKLGLVGIILIMVYSAWQANLFECAVLVGRSFFALLLAFAACEPLTRMLDKSFQIPTPYLRLSAAFFAWIVTIMFVDRASRSGMKRREAEKMKSHATLSLPGRVAAGAATGFFIAGFLSIIVVMVPRVEGKFVQSNSSVVFGLPSKSAAVYAALDGKNDQGSAEVLQELRVPAGRKCAGKDPEKARKLREYYRTHLGLNVRVPTTRPGPRRSPSPPRGRR